ncbi:hypothetical protein ACFL6S_18305 [Candidatus Poribacteria bacterium]
MYAAGGKTAVSRKVDIVYTEMANKEERLKRIAEILSEGVYAYLKENRLLRTDQIERMKGRLPGIEIRDQTAENMDGGSLKKYRLTYQ